MGSYIRHTYGNGYGDDGMTAAKRWKSPGMARSSAPRIIRYTLREQGVKLLKALSLINFQSKIGNRAEENPPRSPLKQKRILQM